MGERMHIKTLAVSIVGAVTSTAALWAGGAGVVSAQSTPPPRALVVGTPSFTCRNPQYATIPAAVAAASPGATIYVCPGTYNTTVNVTKPLRFLGAQHGVDARYRHANPSRESTISSPTGGFIVQGGVSNVTIDGFTISNAGTPTQNADGIDAFAGGAGYNFVNNVIGNNSYGINFQSNGTARSLVARNRFRNNNQTGSAGGSGVFISNGPADDTSITQNAFSGHGSAAVNTAGNPLHYSTGLSIDNNTSTNDATFVVVVNATSPIVSNNRITHTNPQDPTAGSAIYLGGNTTGVRARRNFILGGAANGFTVTNVYGAANTNLDLTANIIRFRLNGFRFTGTQNTGTVARNFITASGNDGTLVDSGNSGLIFTANVNSRSSVLDCEDDTTGSGTAGTANTWTRDLGRTQRPRGICIG
jgi:hypothetical protein